MALGADIGGVAGAILGSVVPGVGTAVGTSAGAGIGGLVDTLSGAGARKKAAGLIPPEVDPMEMQNLNDLDLKRKQFLTGTAFQGAQKEINENQAATDEGIVQASGGSGGAAIAGMVRASQAAGDNFAKVVGAGENQQAGYDQTYNTLLQRIAARRMGIQRLKYNQALTDATAEQQTGEENLGGSLARLGSLNLISKSTVPPTPSPAYFPKQQVILPGNPGAGGVDYESNPQIANYV